ncbi:hypothetical protein HDU91_005607 [Kappamyces sp. JEL0680]|nr:hypothetical protein HDU91_005607 [Kappamyces sp. JEL0680]
MIFPLQSLPRLARASFHAATRVSQPASAVPKHLQPSYDHPALVSPPIPDFEYHDAGLRVDSCQELLEAASQVVTTTPIIGSELLGLQLLDLAPRQLDMLGRFVAERGVVFLRNQKGIDNVERLLDIGRHFSNTLHIHQTYPIAKDRPMVHVVSHDDHSPSMFDRVSTSVRWHSDVTYERQPPGLTFLLIQELPAQGGDTVWSSQYAAYDRLSKPMQDFLVGLTAIHSGVEQAQMAARTGLPLRRDPISTEHPVVRFVSLGLRRTHPVTGKKALFVNPMFTRSIVQLKEEESRHMLEYLYRHVAVGLDFQARFKWQPNSIAIWDNRCTMHTGIVDYQLGVERRHAYRITPQAEMPAALWTLSLRRMLSIPKLELPPDDYCWETLVKACIYMERILTISGRTDLDASIKQSPASVWEFILQHRTIKTALYKAMVDRQSGVVYAATERPCPAYHPVLFGTPQACFYEKVDRDLTPIVLQEDLEGLEIFDGKVPLFVDHLQNLESLRLDKVTDGIPDCVGNLRNLTDLDVIGNGSCISRFAFLARMVSLRHLFLSKCGLTEIPELASLVHLEYLGLDINQIQSIPPHLAEMKALTHLYLSQNQLSTLPDLSAMRLRVLDLSHNSFLQLPKSLGRMKTLTRLSFSHNRFSLIPSSVLEQTSLEFLDLSHNRLIQVSSAIGQLVRLTYLDLSDNRLKQLPESISMLTALIELNLGGNKLVTPPNVSHIDSLQNMFFDIPA